MKTAFVSLAFLITASAAYADPVFRAPDENARKAMEEIRQKLPSGTQAAWVTVADGEAPFLFLIPPDKCGASDCLIIGYTKMADGWHEIYEVFGGEGIALLDNRTDGHHDIQQFESRGASAFVTHISRWNGDHYEIQEEKASGLGS